MQVQKTQLLYIKCSKITVFLQIFKKKKKRNTLALLVGMQTGAAALENSVEVPQKVKNKSTLRPSSCTTRYFPKGYINADSKEYMHPNVDSSTLNNSQTMETAQMSIN